MLSRDDGHAAEPRRVVVMARLYSEKIDRCAHCISPGRLPCSTHASFARTSTPSARRWRAAARRGTSTRFLRARRGAPRAHRRGRGAPGAAQRGVQGDRRAHEGGQARRGRGRARRRCASSTTRSPRSRRELDAVDADARDLLLTGPNIPDASVPVGADENDNVEVAAGARRASSTSSRRRTGTSARRSASSTSSGR